MSDLSADPNALKETHDPSLAAFSNEQVGQTNQAIANNYGGAAMAAGRGLLNTPNPTNSSLSYGDQATTSAIQSRYQQKYNQGEAQLKTDIMKSAESDHVRNLQVATDAAGKEVELNKQKALLKWKIDQANKKARGAVVGEVLGIVAGAATTYFSGGNVAAGAAAYQAGKGVGQSAGGN